MQGGLGMGVDPDCLKAGGAAGGVNENRWDPADYPAAARVLREPVRSNHEPGGRNPAGALRPARLLAAERAREPPGEPGSLRLDLLATIDFLPASGPRDCLLSIFGSRDAALARPRPSSRSARSWPALIAGEHNAKAQGFFTVFAPTRRGLRAILQFTPVRNLNDDLEDGVITALGPLCQPDHTPGNRSNDLLTLDQVLSNEQRALLGCGPFYGTRCDSGAGGIVRNPLQPTHVHQLPGGGMAVRRRHRPAEHRGERIAARLAGDLRYGRGLDDDEPGARSSRGRSASPGVPSAPAR